MVLSYKKIRLLLAPFRETNDLFTHLALVVKKKTPPASAVGVRDTSSIPGSGRSPGRGNGNPPQYSCLENPMDSRACGLQSIGVQSQTQLK